MTRIGSLFSGYGGLDMAVQAALGGGQVVWHCDKKPASLALLHHRHPNVPIHPDMRFVHWGRVEPIDVLAASWPCQPHSSAGKRLGEADPRALWPTVERAIAATRPRIFFGENVARITSNGELRRVVRSLAALGYVGAWRVQRASDVYAPHQRARCFVVAVDAAAYAGGFGRLGGPRGVAAGRHTSVGGEAVDHAGDSHRASLTLLPTPTQSMTTGAGTSGRDGGLSLQTAAITLLPTPTARDAKDRGNFTEQADRRRSLPHRIKAMETSDVSWGTYAEAIARWGCATGREAPAPTQLGTKGQPQLSPRFVEWMPAGHVCDVPGLSRNQQLSLLGDGVVPQQGAAAFSFLLGHLAQRLAVAA
jgi:DNA (cytosine-5)-methyltransferase 1